MLRRISVLLLSVLLMLALPGNVALAQAEPPLAPPGQDDDDPSLMGRGAQRAEEEPQSTGPADDPATRNDWGSVASQLGNEGIMGAHSRDPVPRVPGNETPRDGLGNVSRNDAGNEGTDPADDTGTRIFDHACIAAATEVPGTDFQPDCEAEPGRGA